MTYQSPLRDLARKLREVARSHIAYSQVCDFMNHVDSHLSAVAFAEETNRAQGKYDRDDKVVNDWPLGCHSPNSCSRNGRCMYVGCRHDGKDIAVLAQAIAAIALDTVAVVTVREGFEARNGLPSADG